MNIERKIEAIQYALKWVECSDAFDSSEDQPREDALAMLEALLTEAEMARDVNEVVDAWAKERPDLSRNVLRKHALQEVRKIYKKAA